MTPETKKLEEQQDALKKLESIALDRLLQINREKQKVQALHLWLYLIGGVLFSIICQMNGCGGELNLDGGP